VACPLKVDQGKEGMKVPEKMHKKMEKKYIGVKE
jgi:hypothetical protein